MNDSDQQYLQSVINDPYATNAQKEWATRRLSTRTIESVLNMAAPLRGMPGEKQYIHPYNRADYYRMLQAGVWRSSPQQEAQIRQQLQGYGFSFLSRLPTAGNAPMYAGQFRFTSPSQYRSGIQVPPTRTVPKTISGPGFRLHKGGITSPQPTYRAETHTVRDVVRDKYEGLNDIVQEATQHTVAGWGDIADIDPDTGMPVGGAKSYIDTSAPETYDDMGVPNEIPTRTIGVDPLGVSAPYNPWQRTKKKFRVTRRGRTAAAVGVGVTSKAADLAFQAFLQGQHEALRIQNRNTEKLAMSASQMAFSNRFRLAHHLARFGSIKARREYLHQAGFDPDAEYGRSLMNMAEIEAADREGRPLHPQPYNVLNRNEYTKGQDWSIPPAYRAGIPMFGGRLGSFNTSRGRFASYHPSSVGYNWDTIGMSLTPTAMLADNPSLQATRESIWEKLYNHLDEFSESLKVAGTLLSSAGGAWATVAGEYDKQGKRITTAASGLIPAPFRNAFVRTASGIRELWSSQQVLYSGRLSAAGSMLGGLAGTIGGIATGNAGVAVGGISSMVGGGAQWWQSGIQSKGLDITGRLNLWNGAFEAIMAPFRIIGPIIHRLISAFKALSLRVLDITMKFSQLGLPLTSLTGVTYANMRTGYSADYMIGANRGTTNSAIESFAGAQMDLYTFGKMDENRLVASALLGTFSDVYAYGGDTQAQYANTVNKVYSQLGRGTQSDQRIMNLARYIDPTIATRVQQMRNLSLLDSNFGDYNYIQSGQWMRDRGQGIKFLQTSDKQRARYTLAGMEANTLMENMGESWNAIVVQLWEKVGRNAAISINNILTEFTETGNWRAIVPKVKDAIKKLWSDALDLFGIEGSFGDWFGSLLKTFTPYIQNWAIDLGAWILRKEADLLEKMAVPLDRFITGLSFLRATPRYEDGELSIDISNPLTDWQKIDLTNKQAVRNVTAGLQGDPNALYKVPQSIQQNAKVRRTYRGDMSNGVKLNTLRGMISTEAELQDVLRLNPSLGDIDTIKKRAIIAAIDDPRAQKQLTDLLFNNTWEKGEGVAYGFFTGGAQLLRNEANTVQLMKTQIPTAEIHISSDNGKEGTVTTHSDGSIAIRGDIFTHTNLVGRVEGVIDNLTGGIYQ